MATNESAFTSFDEEQNLNATALTDSSHPDKGICSAGNANETQSKWVQEWNRVFILVCVAGLVVDPLFFYSLSVNGIQMCLFIDGWFAITVVVLRCMMDAVYVWNIWIKLKTARKRMQCNVADYVEEVKTTHTKKFNNVESKKGLFFDLFVILPMPQVVLWVVTPILISKGFTTTVMTVLLITFLFQYLPKIYHSIYFFRNMQNYSGYIFGTMSWGIALNLTAYLIASHAVGAIWYLLGTQRTISCLNAQCFSTKGCGLDIIGCATPILYDNAGTVNKGDRLSYSSAARTNCLENPDQFDYGGYKWTLLLVANTSRLEKILLPIFWGLMNLTTFGGGLASSTDCLEIVFNIIVVTTGLLLVTMLIGNIKVFLHSATSKKQAMHLKMRSLEWWMSRQQLPKGIKRRVRQYERQRWAAMRGLNESEMIQIFPEGLRRDVKYHLCLDLIRQVPLFQHMDEVVLENICDRVQSQILPKGEIITREGDPVQRMLFIVRGHLQSSQVVRDGVESFCMLGPGNFSGDELLSWCLRRPFIDRLPTSSSTLVTLETTEAFSLDANDVKYVTQNFRYTFVSDKVKRSARYYSPGWRTWAAVSIQLAWRKNKRRINLAYVSLRRPASPCTSPSEERVRHYAALLTSHKPNNDHLS